MIEMLPGIGGKLLTGFQIVSILTSYGNEANPATRVKYSKFAQDFVGRSSPSEEKKSDDSDSDSSDGKPMEKEDRKISSRNGMLLIYGPSLAVGILSLAFCDAFWLLPARSPAMVMLFVHFLKRVLEVLFLHVYSGTVSAGVSSMIGTYYALGTYLIGSVAETTIPSSQYQRLVFGSTMFIVGIIGNLYHHYLLASLRKNRSGATTKRYIAPHGGLFDYVAAPHYLFELMGWLGIAIVANHLNAYLMFGSMCSYLAGRAVSQNAWNQKVFTKDEWPTSRKNLIPFLF